MLDSGCSIPDKEKRQLPLKELPFFAGFGFIILTSKFFIRYSSFFIDLRTLEP